ncbi:indolepyruvate oxidoreductase subunit beta [Thermococcus thioreducens]|uniref:Indolepyruvate ferredoxin oxidoreductase beta subunit n=1 Tax=Thermococcus thioreducens TaxID=277988 RepID=A0A0Q2MP94_9EURY|nr:indolepyruvate oxidoreductase subunit beta [Thermococcus thioreducens]ASJ13204.1 indolepyruvate oxidoreductase subunit B [Thermococcus thioreducens]KQH81519.1 indolepyruvate oxidoreductase subunit B [Thermococcus thioreducens]SEW20926.1 indolepyruvate ferredoxin oxidoreductase beta subunit [Thermococcus thioreducens]
MEFNLIITGVGGQGGLTLSRIVGNAAMHEGYNVRIGETLGMSQRYGSVLSYLRFGEDVYSPLIEEGKANLMLALEPAEALRNARFLGKESHAVVNAYPIHTATTLVGKENYPALEEIREALGRICPVYMMDFQREADRINPRTLGVLMLGYAFGRGLVPLRKESLLEGIRSTLREKLWEVNFRALERGIELAKG